MRNIRHDGAVRVRINSQVTPARGRVIRAGTTEDARARRLLDEKYMGGALGKPLSGWARTALPLAIDLPVERP